MKDITERKAVLFSECDVQAIVGGCGLQFEIEAAAETLAQSQSPGFVDPRSKRSVDHKLHSATFVEESLGDDRGLRGDIAQPRAAFKDVLNGLRGSGFVQAALLAQPRNRLGDLRRFG